MPEIRQENLGNLIRGKEDIIKIKNFRTAGKSYLETQWKSNKNLEWDKNSRLTIDQLDEVLLQSKENRNCLGLTPARRILVARSLYIFLLIRLC